MTTTGTKKSKDNEIELLNINRDVVKVKEEQLKELAADSQHQSQKTQQLLGFFGAVSAIIFSQEGIKFIPQRLLGAIFVVILAFIAICIMSFFGKSVTAMIKVGFISDLEGTEQYYLFQKIKHIDECQNNLRTMISNRNMMNNIASLLFAILIVIYSFIFLIYNTNDINRASNVNQMKGHANGNFNTSDRISKYSNSNRFGVQ